IRRRLFDDIGTPEMIDAAISKYFQLYQQYWTEMPPIATKDEYRRRMLKSYPFHPELIDVFRIRWASHHDFQRTRGALRLLAAIVSDLWRRQQSLPGSNLLIHSGDVNFNNVDAVQAQLKRLYGNGYDAVMTADVAGSASNAFKIDSNKKEYGQWYLTQSIAATILLNSFGSDGANKGISVADLKLNLLSPGGFNHNNINGALDELESNAYYLYYSQSGSKRYWFHTKPNINILINQAKANISQHDIDTKIAGLIKDATNRRIELFNTLVDPANDLPEQMRPTLIILSPRHFFSNGKPGKEAKQLIEQLATKKGNSERIYRNTILFLAANETGTGKLNTDLRELLACQKINQDYASQLEAEQKADLKKKIDDAQRRSETALVNAYSIIARHSAKSGIDILQLRQFKDSLDSQISQHVIGLLKDEEWLLETIGINTLRNNNLLPNADQSVKVKDVFEAFLRYDDKPMITGQEAIARSLQRYCTNGEFCIATGDGTNFTRYYYKETIPFFEVNDATYWLVDKSRKPAPEAETQTADNPENTIIAPSQVNEDPHQSVNAADAFTVKQFKSLIISGNVPLERYTELFNYFITPFAMNGNKIEIAVKFKIKSTTGSVIDETRQQYKSAKEAARQLGLNFEEEE
ncbi:MAG TPA: DUF499 domain-containing protein, partial [Agriterribacter sp.]|nr:DUF499 domain-containing protein [Agriterribacter sp.]